MSEMKRCECQGGFDVEIIAPDGTPIVFPTRAEVQVARKQAWEDGANWMLQRFLEIPASVRAGLEAMDGHFLTYMGKSLSYHAEQYALPNHDPRKGAE